MQLKQLASFKRSLTRFFFLYVLLITSSGVFAQQASQSKNDRPLLPAESPAFKKVVFPADFVGQWKGQLTWTQVGKTDPQKISMRLNIQHSKTPGEYTWHLIYGDSAKDSRPYILKPVDSTKGHWVIDELNGIILDQYWNAQRLSGAFTVQSSTIVNNYWIEGPELHIEFISYSAKPINTTGKGNNEIPFVNSYEIKSFQKAVLRKHQK